MENEKEILAKYRDRLKEILFSGKREYIHSGSSLDPEVIYPATAPLSKEDDKAILREIRQVTNFLNQNKDEKV